MNSKIKKIIKKIPLLKGLYSFISKKRYKSKLKRENAIFRKNGSQAFAEICEILNKENINYFVDMGTLLGIIRESHLLDFDKDFDFGIVNSINIEEFIQIMQSNGFKTKEKYRTDGIGITQVSFYYKKIRVDFCFYFKKNKEYLCYLFYLKHSLSDLASDNYYDVVALKCSYFFTTTFKYQNITIKIPNNVEKYLEERYGNWREPNKNYCYWKGPSATPIENKGYIL